MKSKTNFEQLDDKDTCSMLLFALYAVRKDPKYALLSELAYILDFPSLTRICQFFGDREIKIPTLDELETLLYAFLIYQRVDLNHENFRTVFEDIASTRTFVDRKELKNTYQELKAVIEDYTFTHRGEDED